MSRTGDANHVAVVGAGLAGLGAAIHLHRAGVPVRVYDAADRVGGKLATDVVDGYRLDVGFQVHNTAYPEPKRLLDEDALQFGHFVRGAYLCEGGKRHLLADPRTKPLTAPALLTAPLGGITDRLALGRLAATALAEPMRVLKAKPELSTYEQLRKAGLSDHAIDRFLRPFLGGVFLERELTTSSRFFWLAFACFLRGSSVLPADGIGAIPAQLASLLPPESLHLGHPVDALPTDAAAVVVATDPVTAEKLVPGIDVPAPTTTTTAYFAADEAPLGEGAILLDASGSPTIQNTVVLTNAVPSYAPAGKHLVAASWVGDGPATTADVQAALRPFYGPAADAFTWLRSDTTSSVEQRAPLGNLRKATKIEDGVYVAGAHRDTASTQGALVSGRRAATAVLADLDITEESA